MSGTKLIYLLSLALWAAAPLPGFPQSALDALPAGTRMRVELESPVSTRTSKAGDGVRARLAEPVTVNGRTAVPEGASLSGHADVVQPSSHKQGLRAQLRLLFETLTLPEGHVLRCQAVIEGLGFNFRVDSQGLVTQPGISRDFEIKQGRKMWLRLDRDLALNPPLSTASGNPERAKTFGPEAAESTVGGTSKVIEGGSTPSKGAGSSPRRKEKSKYSVRMGETLITVVAAGPGSSAEAASPQQKPSSKHSFFIVRVNVQNVGKQFPCTRLEAALEVLPYYLYKPDFSLSKGLPGIDELLPGEEVEGEYVFRVRDGTAPVAFVVSGSEVRDERCAEHPDWGSIWHPLGTDRISLQGLPLVDSSHD